VRHEANGSVWEYNPEALVHIIGHIFLKKFTKRVGCTDVWATSKRPAEGLL
jgi:hypothetical protein